MHQKPIDHELQSKKRQWCLQQRQHNWCLATKVCYYRYESLLLSTVRYHANLPTYKYFGTAVARCGAGLGTGTAVARCSAGHSPSTYEYFGAAVARCSAGLGTGTAVARCSAGHSPSTYKCFGTAVARCSAGLWATIFAMLHCISLHGTACMHSTHSVCNLL